MEINMKQEKTDWLFIITFYIGGLALMAFGLSGLEKYAGAGLFLTLFGIGSVFTATYHIPNDGE